MNVFAENEDNLVYINVIKGNLGKLKEILSTASNKEKIVNYKDVTPLITSHLSKSFLIFIFAGKRSLRILLLCKHVQGNTRK